MPSPRDRIALVAVGVTDIQVIGPDAGRVVTVMASKVTWADFETSNHQRHTVRGLVAPLPPEDAVAVVVSRPDPLPAIGALLYLGPEPLLGRKVLKSEHALKGLAPSLTPVMGQAETIAVVLLPAAGDVADAVGLRPSHSLRVPGLVL